MLRKSKCVFIIGILGVTVYGGTVLATPGSGLTITPLGRATFDEIHVVKSGPAKVKIKTKGDVDVIVVSGTVAPGGYSGWVSHPGPVFFVIKSGALALYNGGDPTCTPQVFQAGEGFIDEGDEVALMFRNESTLPADFVATQIVQAGETMTRIDLPAPGNCPF